MTPQDVLFFKVLAALFTFSFMALVFFVMRYLQGLLEGRSKLIAIIAELGRGLDPVLAEIRAGVHEFRSAGAHLNHSAGQMAALGDRISELAERTQNGVKTGWALVAQAVSVLLRA